MKETIKIIAQLELIETSCQADFNSVQDAINYISKLNPNRIDEERMSRMWKERYNSIHWDQSETKRFVDQYNSTLPEPLKPLPEKMPENLWNTNRSYLWKELIKHYGTPQKELPSVEELVSEMKEVYEKTNNTFVQVAQHLIDKYKLDSKKDVFPFNLKSGDKFMVENRVEVFSDLMINSIKGDEYFIDACHPYTESEFEIEYNKHNYTPNIKHLIKLACEETLKNGKIPEIK